MAAIGDQYWFYTGFPQGFSTPGNLALDSATDALQFIFQAPPSGPTLSKAAIRWGAKTGTPPVYRLSLQGVDASTGYADGTIKGGGSPASVNLPTDASAGNVGEYTFANSYDSAPGEMLALVIDTVNTPDGSNNWSFSRVDGAAGIVATGVTPFPYSVAVNSGTPAKYNAWPPMFAVGDGSTWWGSVLSQTATGYVTAGSDPAYAGVKFTVPAGAGDTVSCVGWWGGMRIAYGQTMTVTLLDVTDAKLASTIYDTDILGVENSYLPSTHYWDDAAVALTCGSTYRIVATGSATFRVPYIDVPSAAMLNIYPWQQIPAWAQGATGSWTDIATRRGHIGPIVSDITEPTASGGGFTGTHQILGLGR